MRVLTPQLCLSKLALFVPQKCCQQSICSEQCPGLLQGVCFFQEPQHHAGHASPEQRPHGQLHLDLSPPLYAGTLSESNHCVSKDVGFVTVPFTLGGVGRDRSVSALEQLLTVKPPLGAADHAQGLQSQGLAQQPGHFGQHQGPTLHGKGHLLSSMKSFQVRGFIFKFCDSLSHQDSTRV